MAWGKSQYSRGVVVHSAAILTGAVEEIPFESEKKTTTMNSRFSVCF